MVVNTLQAKLPQFRTALQFHQFANIFPEAVLLVDADGLVLAVNKSAQRHLAPFHIQPDRCRLDELCRESPEQIFQFLRACGRTRSFIPGALTFGADDEHRVVYRAEGALFTRDENSAQRQILIRLQPREVSGGRFLTLNQQIDQLSREVDRRRRAELELLEEQRRKDEFLAMLGHELRNPLSPIKAALQLQALPDVPDEVRERSTSILNRQVDHLTRLVDDLLDVARISRGMILLKSELLEVGSIIYRASELCQPVIQEKDQHLSIEMAPEPLYVVGDLQRLTQVVGNVLNNAAKYTHRGGTIRLLVSRRHSHLNILVADNGMGIDPPLLPRIFDVFSQSERTIARSEGGLGVGLTIVKRLVEQHGGKVSVSSEGLGKGSEFMVSLPLADAPLAPELPDSAEATAPGTGLRVLVVDDNADAGLMLAELLGFMGYEVLLAENGQQALAAADSSAPNLIFLDIGLPDMSGYDVARTLRTRPASKDTILVALTGYGQADDIQQAMSAGFDHHLVKPADIGRMMEILASLQKK
ncbi:hybrid sensor histidine kinase/response regulator [Allohahella marinimesophila]|uniref:histidine kinase n=1 Tax=Allohahella marinimesophila TaxID=1054972 RepID=A0ABP7Q1Y8_9GAMM